MPGMPSPARRIWWSSRSKPTPRPVSRNSCYNGSTWTTSRGCEPLLQAFCHSFKSCFLLLWRDTAGPAEDGRATAHHEKLLMGFIRATTRLYKAVHDYAAHSSWAPLPYGTLA